MRGAFHSKHEMSDESESLPEVRTGQGSTKLGRAEFEARYKQQFADPGFRVASAEIDRITQLAWEAYEAERKNPQTRKAGPEFANPDYELSVDWLEARARLKEAQREFESSEGPSRILLI